MACLLLLSCPLSNKLSGILFQPSSGKNPLCYLTSDRLNKFTSTSFVQLSFAKPELRSVDGARVELQPEHSVSVGALGSSVVAFDLQRAAARRGEEAQIKRHVG